MWYQGAINMTLDFDTGLCTTSSTHILLGHPELMDWMG
jgi:hypothetical protein